MAPAAATTAILHPILIVIGIDDAGSYAPHEYSNSLIVIYLPHRLVGKHFLFAEYFHGVTVAETSASLFSCLYILLEFGLELVI